MARGIFVPSLDTDPLEVREFSGLEDYQAAVEGYIEPVDIPDLGITIYVNEEGLIRHLPFNSRASFLWWYHVPRVRNRAMLVGDAVIVGMPNASGESTDVPDELEELLMSPGEYVVQLELDHGQLWTTDRGDALANVALPIIHGDPAWLESSARYEDYLVAAVWAMVLHERLPGVVVSRIVSAVDRDPTAS